jgi:diguanylate cyclase (GGDEF)-like protein/PAS domain S-box-containing protein
MTRLVFEHQRGHLRRERSHALPEGFTAAKPFPTHFEFAAMFAAFADVVTLHDLDGTIRLASPSCRAILGLAPDQLIGRLPSETLVCAEDLPLLTAAIDRLRGGEDSVALIYRGRTTASRTAWLEARIGAVTGLKGSATGFLAVSRPVSDRIGAEQLREQQLERYRHITDAVPGMTAWVVDRELRCRFAAGAGFPSIISGPDACVDRPLAQLLSADRYEVTRRHVAECFAGFTPTEESSRPGRHQFWTRYLPVASSSGVIEEVIIVNLEVTDRERTHEALRRSEASFSSAFDNSPIGMAIIAPDGSVLRANDAFCALTRRSRAELHRGSWSELIHPDDVEANRELTVRMLAGERRTAMVERRYVRPDHSVVHTVMSITLVRDDEGRPLHLVTQALDVTDRHRLEAYLEELVLRDPLTGAHNRRALDVELARRLGAESAEAPRGALVLFDIDHFKDLNDTLGHDVGDDVLRHLVAKWRERLRRSDVLVRIGGDEFVVLLGDSDADSVESVARDLLTLADNAILTVTGIASSVSAGMALFRPDENAAQLLRRADDALYLAKRAGRGRLVVDRADSEF